MLSFINSRMIALQLGPLRSPSVGELLQAKLICIVQACTHSLGCFSNIDESFGFPGIETNNDKLLKEEDSGLEKLSA
jgi:hypothetical protein